MWRKLYPNGLTQNRSGNSGSRTVMCPATPSANPSRPKIRNAPASLALRCARSSSTLSNVGGSGIVSSVFGTSGMPSIVRTSLSVIAMPQAYCSGPRRPPCDTRRVNREIRPTSIAPPAANYAHAILTEGPGRWLHTAGVVPIAPDGSVPTDLGEQAAQVWANVAAMLSEARMVAGDIVSITTYAVAGEELAPIMRARDEFLEGRRVASTLVTVPELARPEWRVGDKPLAAAPAVAA